MQVHMKRCEDHRCDYLGDCPFCTAGLEPTRFGEAREDFRGVPLAGTVDILPHYRVVSLEDVVRVLGSQLLELETLEAKALEPFVSAKQIIYRQMRRARMEPRIVLQAVRVLMGASSAVSAHMIHQDPAVQAVLDIIGGARARAEDLPTKPQPPAPSVQ